MLGPSEGADGFQHEIRGLIPRAFDHLFTRIKEEKDINGGGGGGGAAVEDGKDAKNGKDSKNGKNGESGVEPSNEKKRPDRVSTIDFVCKCSFLEIYNEQVKSQADLRVLEYFEVRSEFIS